MLNTSGSWERYDLDGTRRWVASGVPSSATMDQALGFWIKRRSSGGTTNAVYTGRAFSSGQDVQFRAGDWHIISWPLPTSMPQNEGAHHGWGFQAAGAKAGSSWMNADRMLVGNGAGQQYLYLNTNGYWCRIGSAAPALDIRMRAGDGFYYLHAGTGFVWAASDK